MTNGESTSSGGPIRRRRPIYLNPVVMVGFTLIILLMLVVAAGRKKKALENVKATPPPAEWVQQQFSIGGFTRAEDLLDATDRLYREGNAKWDERDLGPGYTYLALVKWSECRFYLRQVDIAAAYRAVLNDKIDAAEANLRQQYQRLVFEENRARSGRDFKTLEQVYKAMMSLLPDDRHSLHQAAQRKLGQIRASQ